MEKWRNEEFSWIRPCPGVWFKKHGYTSKNVKPAKYKSDLASNKVMLKLDEAKKRGIKKGKQEGNPLQLPALFLIDTDGIVDNVHYGKNAGDIPSIDEMLEML